MQEDLANRVFLVCVTFWSFVAWDLCRVDFVLPDFLLVIQGLRRLFICLRLYGGTIFRGFNIKGRFFLDESRFIFHDVRSFIDLFDCLCRWGRRVIMWIVHFEGTRGWLFFHYVRIFTSILVVDVSCLGCLGAGGGSVCRGSRGVVGRLRG